MISYLLNSVICLLAFYIVYQLLLSREKSYRFNRFFLLGAVVLGLLFPSFDLLLGSSQFIFRPGDSVATIDAGTLTDIKKAPTKVLTGTLFSEGTAKARPSEETALSLQDPGSTTLPIGDLIVGLYLLVTLIFLSRYVYGIYSIYKTQSSIDHKVQEGTTTIYLSEDKVSPHSFMDAVFVNKQDYEDGLIDESIIQHEMAHIRDKHTLDILFIELLCVVFWFNPALYLYRRAIKINHEFLADDAVVGASEDIPAYQKQLLQLAEDHLRVRMASNLNFFLTKKRLQMMFKERSQFRTSIKAALILPLIPLSLLFYNAQVIDPEAIIGHYEVDLNAEQVAVTENYSYPRWKTQDGNYFSGVNQYFYAKTGLLLRESVYQEGRLIERRHYNDLGLATPMNLPSAWTRCPPRP